MYLMTENDSPKITRQTLGGSGNAPKITKAQESVNAPSRAYCGSQDAPPITNAKGKEVSSKITAND